MGLILFAQAIGIDLYVLSVLCGGSTYHSETYIDCKISPCCVWYVQTRHLLQPELVLEDVSQDHARKTVCYTLNSYDILEYTPVFVLGKQVEGSVLVQNCVNLFRGSH
jgi:hypothetical protein